jgi:hypothetical protein
VGKALAVQQDVGRLEVAVQDAALVRVVDRPGHQGEQPGAGAGVGLEVGQPAGQAAALQQRHAEVEVVPVPADLVDGHDVRVVQGGDRLRLLAEALDVRLGVPVGEPEHLQRHEPVRALLPGLVDHPHPALGDLLQQLVIERGRGGARRVRCLLVDGGVRGRGHPGPEAGGLGHGAEWFGPAFEPVLLGEEGVQLVGKVGVAGQQLGAVGRAAVVGRPQVSAQDLVQPPLTLG